jgi:hypothetical protein
MPITLQTMSAEDVTTLRDRARVLSEKLDEKRLLATLVYLLWSIYGDPGSDIDLEDISDNTEVLEEQMTEKELKAALLIALWASPGA